MTFLREIVKVGLFSLCCAHGFMNAFATSCMNFLLARGLPPDADVFAQLITHALMTAVFIMPQKIHMGHRCAFLEHEYMADIWSKAPTPPFADL